MMTMRKFTMMLVLVVGVTGLAFAQEEGQATPPPAGGQEGQMTQDQMMKQWAEMNKPGPQHEEFKKCVGSWKHVTKMWMDPTAEPTVSEGTCERTLEFGGRYLKEHYRCTSEEMPFEGIALTAYDTMKKKYISIWFDSMSTGIMVSEGEMDDATKTMTMHSAEYDDPFMGKGKMKNVIKHVSDDEQVMEMYWIGQDGKEMKQMEIRYTRA